MLNGNKFSGSRQTTWAHIGDPRRLIADRIVDGQIREIAEMKREIVRLEAVPVPASAPDLPSYRDRAPHRSPATATRKPA